MHTYNLCSPTFKTDVYSARYMKKKPNLFCYLKYNGEVKNEICIVCFLNNLKCTTQIFFHSTHLLKDCNTPLLHCNML